MKLLDVNFDEMKSEKVRPFDDGDIVTCMLLRQEYASQHRKEIDRINDINIKEAESLGETYDIIRYSCKAGGLQWLIAILNVVNRYNDDAVENIWEDSNGNIRHPGFIANCLFYQPPIHKHKELVNKKGILYGDIFSWGGSSKVDTDGTPERVMLYPSVRPIANPTNDDKIAKREKSRIEQWSNLLKLWEEASEEECEEYLNRIISRRLFLCHKEENKYVYIKPEPGITFRAAIRYGSSMTYPNIETTTYNNGEVIKVGLFNVYPPTEEEKLMASAIEQCIDLFRFNYEEKDAF